MFFSWNKIILILYNLQADQDQKRAFFTEIGLSYIQFICFVWSLFTKWIKKHFVWVSMYLARKY